ncbi:hypothetical protein [Ideonella sp. BN130291]|uniref:hypothetical protein n=1 Tax=Ideonella sp. BN130291 TaxID=3112940 RepID=UPI002E27253C|nr:hypothetical protein [Ideonella sp. BN130291]
MFWFRISANNCFDAERSWPTGKPPTSSSCFKGCDAETDDDDKSAKLRCRFATAGTLVALGSDWLTGNPEAQKRAYEVVRAGIAEVASTAKALRERRNGIRYDELKFVTHAVMRLWLANGDGSGAEEWESAVLRLLTSGDLYAATVVVDIAYAHREQLGTAWWRLLRVGLLWAGLSMLTPKHGDDERDERIWSRWLARLRRLPLRDSCTNPEQLDLDRVVAGLKRLDYRSRVRKYKAGDRKWLGKPKRDRGLPLDSQILDILFNWLIAGAGTGDLKLDARLTTRIWNYDATRAKARREDRGEYDLPSQNLGYNVLQKLAALSTTASATDNREVWEPVLNHGPAAHYALRHFISSFFLLLGQGSDPTRFETVWRGMAEYGLAANWSLPRLWFHGERLIGDLLGFGNEETLCKLDAGAALRMKDVYKRWAEAHLTRDDENLTRFSYFLASNFGAPIRLDGIAWIAAMLTTGEREGGWRRDDTGDALLELVAVALGADAQALSREPVARQGLVEIAAALAAKNMPMALALQERIRQLK